MYNKYVLYLFSDDFFSLRNSSTSDNPDSPDVFMSSTNLNELSDTYGI